MLGGLFDELNVNFIANMKLVDAYARATKHADSPMRASPTGTLGSDDSSSADAATERALQAACLLREALALLGHERAAVTMLSTLRTSDRLLRLPEVQRLTGLRRSAIYEQMQRGLFPKSVKASRALPPGPNPQFKAGFRIA